MKSTNQIYTTEAGKKLANTLHECYWDALEETDSIADAIRAAIKVAPNDETRKELEAAAKQIVAAYRNIGKMSRLVADKTI